MEQVQDSGAQTGGAGFASCHATTLRTFGLIVKSMYPDEAKDKVLRGRSVSIWHWDGQVIH
jgi:hypothetical protein